MGEPVEKRAGQPFRAEDLGPLVERQVAGDQSGGAFIALADGLEQQLGTGFRERHVTKFVYDQQFMSGQLLLEPSEILFVARLDQFANQCGGSEEADTEATLMASPIFCTSEELV
jgi:hypothetical protein